MLPCVAVVWTKGLAILLTFSSKGLTRIHKTFSPDRQEDYCALQAKYKIGWDKLRNQVTVSGASGYRVPHVINIGFTATKVRSRSSSSSTFVVLSKSQNQNKTIMASIWACRTHLIDMRAIHIWHEPLEQPRRRPTSGARRKCSLNPLSPNLAKIARQDGEMGCD